MRALLLAVALSSCADWRDDLASWNREKPLPRFPLVDQHEQPVSLRGEPTLIAFAFSRCAVPSACPQTIERLRALEGSVRTVVVTLDPEHDTPAVLRAWAARSGLTGTTFVTGEREVIDALASCFNVFITRDMSHPVKAALLHDGKVVRTFTDNNISLGAQSTGGSG